LGRCRSRNQDCAHRAAAGCRRECQRNADLIGKLHDTALNRRILELAEEVAALTREKRRADHRVEDVTEPDNLDQVLICRLTGHVLSDRFTCTVTALIRS
jgi:phage-related minor tail protein